MKKKTPSAASKPVSTGKQRLRLGHSPDPDDAFMFYALAKNKIPTHGFRFEHFLADIQTLNELAEAGKLEVTAVSLHAYAYLTKTYALLSSGASMGEGYGPMVVSKDPLSWENMRKVRIAVPGEKTTAFLALQLFQGKFEYEVMPFDKISKAVRTGKVRAGLIIHEGQITYKSEGLRCALDLGLWWQKKTGLALPLGVNVVKRSLGREKVKKISGILRNSIAYGLRHRRDALDYAMQFGRDLDHDLTDRFVGMYVNHFTEDFGPKGRQAVETFLQECSQRGLIPPVPKLEFV